MKKLSYLPIALIIGIIFLSKGEPVHALTLSNTNPIIGQQVLVTDPHLNSFYSVYWQNVDGPKTDPCAYISGEELVQDNDLTNYGTCFINKSGTFQVVELSESFLANFTDSIKSPALVDRSQVVVRNIYLFEAGLAISDRKGITSLVTWQQNAQRKGVVSLETYLSRW
jgi:hypothetical protein